MSELIVGRIYRHYKARDNNDPYPTGHYKLITLAKMEADAREVAVYVSLDDEQFWVRPVGEFKAKFTLLHPRKLKHE